MTAENEPLSSALENFITAFFGTVTKTVVDGAVVWTLPCDLEQGLPDNPRLENEGLACYMMRLFEAGIIGLAGPQGDPGTTGTAGKNAYTTVAEAFSQPTEICPNLMVVVADASVIPVGVFVYIQNSGWYEVLSKVGNQLALHLEEAYFGAPGTIDAGSFVMGTGPRGPLGTKGAKGDTGDTGAKGDTGAAGDAGATGASAMTLTTASFTQPAVGATVSVFVEDSAFFASPQQVFLPGGGYYEVSSVAPGTLTLRNLTDAATNAAPGATVASGTRVSTAGFGPIAPSASAVGVGTNYALTGSTAAVVFGTSQIDLSLPMAGTYWISVSLHLHTASAAASTFQVKLRNTTLGTDIAGTTQDLTVDVLNEQRLLVLNTLVNVASATTIKAYAHRSGAGADEIVSTQSTSQWIRVGP